MRNDEAMRRVAMIASGSFFVGPALARVLAARGHDLALANPEDGLVAELEGLGATVEVIDGVARSRRSRGPPTRWSPGTLARFGRIDAACCSPARS